MFRDGLLHGSTELECFQPVRPGDEITVTAKIASIRERSQMAFVTFEISYTNQKRELVARCQQTMIGYKTAVLIACSLQIGAIIADASENDINRIYAFGYNIGMAFQLQDDYLDTFGSDNFGKKLGGDIIENKKTYLFIKAPPDFHSHLIELSLLIGNLPRGKEPINEPISSIF